MKLGIVGLPNVGKSTLFNAITQAGAESANYPFCTIDPNVGVVSVPDRRLDILKDLYDSKKIVQTAIEFVDIAGLVKGASKGEGLGNKFLSNIREVDAIVHVVRCFEDSNVVHVDGSINSLRDIETINIELIFSDMEILDRRIVKTTKALKADKKLQSELDILNQVKATLEEGKSIRTMELSDDEWAYVNTLDLLSSKPVIYVSNVSEEDLANDGADNSMVAAVREFAKTESSDVVVICAQIEAEISELETDEEKKEFLETLGLEQSGLDKLIQASYHLLGLISFLTAGPQEVRAWTIKKGSKAPQAGGKIHSDIERGFIKAETIAFDDLVEHGTMSAAKEKGLVRLEGKEYVVKDGDVILFKFNV
ncbi:redox-regulated ATPase YchF [Peptostreptococcus porci]|uniref:redox-regulated ATPase YchF n=1 Tax=Peptostreptococcus porci TaxID=2652282 RepID=UPI0023F23063|nr:redox-regulated ATPase YchF [Peptostreptococcus porci]MDD7183789.1 redox-regulated ATPase YchF [Peptostreptococcus porci]MDY5964659.1 redox-regulated ATPase YchF [Peptostreptococcus porci]